ncbi:MAG: hypothetical protein QM530_04110 [Phycisphaerales bacterium]|nr:hypothetical protein [Phycisphaerales bacterium]
MGLNTYSKAIIRLPVQSLKKAFSFNEPLPKLVDEGIYLSSPITWEQSKKTITENNGEANTDHLVVRTIQNWKPRIRNEDKWDAELTTPTTALERKGK